MLSRSGMLSIGVCGLPHEANNQTRATRAITIAVDVDADAADIASAIEAAKRRIKAAVPYDCVIDLEPALS